MNACRYTILAQMNVDKVNVIKLVVIVKILKILKNAMIVSMDHVNTVIYVGELKNKAIKIKTKKKKKVVKKKKKVVK